MIKNVQKITILLRIATENQKHLAYNITQTRRKMTGSYVAVKSLSSIEKNYHSILSRDTKFGQI